MKFYKVLLLSAFALATISCMEEQFDEGGNDCQMQSVLLEANISGESEKTKTGMTSDEKGAYDPYWEPDDCIGVVSSNPQTNVLPTVFYNEKFKNQSKEKSKTTSFAGKITFAADHIYAYYPYTKSNLKADPNSIRVDVNIPNVQFPGADTFDGNADFMYTTKTNVPSSTDNSIKTSMSVDFIRASRFLKIVFRDDTKDKKFEKEHVKSVRIETIPSTETLYLAGTYRFDLVNSSYAKLVNNQSNIITAMHVGLDNQYVINGKNGTFISVYPSRFPQDTKLHIECTTDRYIFSKDVILNQDFLLENGKFSVLGIKIEDGTFKNLSSPKKEGTAWQNYLKGEGPLKDYSYAGYMRGEEPLPTVTMSDPTPGRQEIAIVGGVEYKVFRVAQQEDKDSRTAFLDALVLAGLYKKSNETYTPLKKPNANVMIYFEKGDHILHKTKDVGNSETINIYAGNFMLKGAGPGTRLIMKTPNNTTSNVLYSTPELILIKNPGSNSSTSISVKEQKGVSSVTVENASKLKIGDWICLTMSANDNDVRTYDLGGHTAESYMEAISNNVLVKEYHQISNIEGNTITFNEPILRDLRPIEIANNYWKITKYSCYSSVGVEDLTFVGCPDYEFVHHRSPLDDGGFKPIRIARVVNSWMRNVNFESVSECATFADCANCTIYNIKISGKRGHAAIRAANSSRCFIGKVIDASEGYVIEKGQVLGGEYMKEAGQYHASGVDKQSIGTVLWRNTWGKDANFESHSSQPRYTLVDCCKGGWVEWRFGGADSQLPNHLIGLTLWNMEATRFYGRPEQQFSYQFWDTRDSGEKWRIVPPIVVGFHGTPSIKFDNSEGQMSHFESPGEKVMCNFNGSSYESLYEAQLAKRGKPLQYK